MIEIAGRRLKIPDDEKILGYVGDNDVDIRIFKLSRLDLSDMFFQVDIRKEDGTTDFIELEKAFEADHLLLTWPLMANQLNVKGKLIAQIEALNANKQVWHSGPGEFIVGNSIKAEADIPSPLPTEFGQFEERNILLAAQVSANTQAVAENTLEVARNTQTVTENTTLVGQKAAAVAEDTAEVAENTEIAKTAAITAANNILNGVDTHNLNVSAHADIREDIREVEAIARGRATAYVFDTYADMVAWLAITANVETLVVGDNLYIRDTGVKDYWWDGTAAQELEAEAPDLTDYYTKTQVDALIPIVIEQSDYDALISAGTLEAGRIYYVVADGAL